MGSSYTPTYRIETRDRSDRPWVTEFSWRKEYGRANEKNLEAWRQKMNESFQPGGVNWHCSVGANRVIHISQARLVRQSTGEVVATVVMPMFEIVASPAKAS